MRFLILPLAALAGFLVGCNKSPEGGTAGTNSSFTITAPTVPTTIKQDNKETVKLSLSRGSEFKKDVKLSVAPVDKLKLDLNKTEIKASDATPAEFTITISPANNYVDELVFAKLKKLSYQPGELCSDEEFLRRGRCLHECAV